jgi:hypothetical protein
MVFFGYVLIGLFWGLCITGAAALIWSLALSIRMTFRFSAKRKLHEGRAAGTLLRSAYDTRSGHSRGTGGMPWKN